MSQNAIDSLNAILVLLVGDSSFQYGIVTVMGIACVISGLYMFKRHTQDSMRWPIGWCVSTCLAGTLLLLADWFFTVLTATVFGQVRLNASGQPIDYLSPVAIDPQALQQQFNAVIGTVGFGRMIPQSTAQGLWIILYLMGIWAYIRGLWKLRYAGDPQSGPGGRHTVGSACWHIFGGFALINITEFGGLVAEMLGF